MTTLLTTDTDLIPISFQHEEGRRIYERSLRFILLLAVSRCFPDARLRIEHSIGYGLYFQLTGRRVVQGDAKLIEDTMREIVDNDLPFVRSRWTRQQAIDYFNSLGWADKADLLSYRPFDTFTIYECGGLVRCDASIDRLGIGFQSALLSAGTHSADARSAGSIRTCALYPAAQTYGHLL